MWLCKRGKQGIFPENGAKIEFRLEKHREVDII